MRLTSPICVVLGVGIGLAAGLAGYLVASADLEAKSAFARRERAAQEAQERAAGPNWRDYTHLNRAIGVPTGYVPDPDTSAPIKATAFSFVAGLFAWFAFAALYYRQRDVRRTPLRRLGKVSR